MEDNFDIKLNKTLDEVSAPSDETLNSIWADIENRIDFDKKMVIEEHMLKRGERKVRLNKRFIIQLSAGIAAALLIALLLASTPVRAMINEIVSFFGYNTSQDYYSSQNVSIRVDASIYESQLGYITYYDNQYFDVTKTDAGDRFIPKADNGKGSGQSFIEVKRVISATAQEAVDAVAEEFKQQYSDVIVTDKNDKTNYSYLFNPLEGINIQGYNSESNNGRKSMKKDSFYEFCSIGELKGIGLVSISYKFNVSDEDTSLRINKLYNDIKIINENSQKYMDQGPNILVFDYDKTKYKLVKIRGEQYVYLSPIDSKTFDPGILSIGHFYNKDMEKAAEELAQFRSSEWTPTDINLKSIMVAYDDNTKIYLIDDGQGGVFELYFNRTPSEEVEKVTNSLRIVPQKDNDELMKPEEIQPGGAG